MSTLMLVSELIAALQELPSDLPVLVYSDSWDWDYDVIQGIPHQCLVKPFESGFVDCSPEANPGEPDATWFWAVTI